MAKDIEPAQIARWREQGVAFVLLDVREPDEWAAASVPQSLQISMREVPQRLAELDMQSTIAVLCHHGGRSERVADFLTARGFTDVVNVAGGIDAYARTVDPSIPVY